MAYYKVHVEAKKILDKMIGQAPWNGEHATKKRFEKRASEEMIS